MNRKELRKVASEIEARIDSLELGVDYDISYFHECETSVVAVDFDIYNSDDCDDDWDCQVEDVMSSIVYDWGNYGWYSWDGWCISVSFPD